MRILAAFVSVLMFSGCHAGDVEAGPVDPGAGPSGQPAKETAGKGSPAKDSEVRWDGVNAGSLRFASAACMVMNGEVINFYAPAKAKDSIGGDPVLPQINGSKAGNGWALNILTAGNVVHSGSGEAGVATARSLVVSGTLLDGVSAAAGGIETVTATFDVECTDVDDLGNF